MSRRTRIHSPSNCFFFCFWNSLCICKLTKHQKRVMLSKVASVQPTGKPHTSWPGSREFVHMSRRASRVCQPEFSVSRTMATGARRCALEPWKHLNHAEPKRHHEISNSAATTTTSLRRATEHAPDVSPYLPAPIDFFFLWK